MVSRRLVGVVAALLVSPVIGACSTPSTHPMLKDPSQWPLARLKGLTSHRELPAEADRALAQVKVGSYDLMAWIHTSGRCGLAGDGWSMYVDLTKSEGQPDREDGFSGPVEPAAGSSHESKVTLFCTPTRMLIRVDGETAGPFVSGDAVAQVVDGGLNAVVGSERARRESLPHATVTKGG